MSSQEILFTVPRPVAVPRGARWAAALAVWLLQRGAVR
jgi:hypothetical protein